MIVNCGPSQAVRCFERGAETGVSSPPPAVAAAPPPAPAAQPADFSLWGDRADTVGVVQYLAEQAAMRGAMRGPKMNMQTGSSRPLKGYTVQPNPFTQCLYRERDLWDHIVSQGGLTRLCCPSMPGKGDPPPWVAMPSEGRRYQQIGSILLPAVEGTDFLVTTFQVPVGYDGVIVSIVNMFTGAGFVEGSGDIHYRIQINRRWLKDYGDIQTTMGTVASPCMIYRGGVRLRTQEVVRYWVNLGAGALGRLDPTGRIVCAFFGWFYPQV
jgi:hypothetical protein